jgi:uncharacterized integral membrane protein (TIGR00697 family)
MDIQSPSTSPVARQQYRYLDIIAVVFTLVLVLSNIASSAKLIDWGFSLMGTRMVFDAGTLFFPVAYIFGDVLTEVYGYQNSRRVIWMGFIGLVFSALMFLFIQKLPGESAWLASGGQQSYNAILGGLSSFGLVLASVAGYLSGSFSNAIVMAVMKHLTKGKQLWLRTIGSTIVGELVDTLIFVLLASLTRVFPWELFASLVLTNYLFKVGIEALMTPATYEVVRRLKIAEGVDTYSDLSDLSPLKL